MSAFRPFAPDVVPQSQSQPQHTYHATKLTPGSGVNGSIGQSGVPSSYCGPGASVLARGQSPDIGYVSLEHPSRTSSFVSQVSVQLSSHQNDLSRTSFGSYDHPPFPRDAQIQGRSRLVDGSTTSPSDSSNSGGLTSYRGSQGSIQSCNYSNGSWLSNRSNFMVDSTPPRIMNGDGSRQNGYSKVSGKGVESTTMEAVKPFPKNGLNKTPASKDSNLSVSDLRNILMIKETELRMMRDTMTKNETAILQVFEDKKRKWNSEMSERRKEWENQLQAAQNKAWKTEQLLQFQVSKLHQENKRLEVKVDELTADKRCLTDRCRSMEQELEGLKSDMRGLLDDVSAKNFDVINHVRSPSIDTDRYKIDSNYAKVDQGQSSPGSTLSYSIQDRSEVTNSGTNPRQKRRMQHQEGQSPEAVSQSWSDSRTLSLPDLQRELEKARREAESYRKEFEQERHTWKTEKEKVIDYQKRLQLSYLQVLHKNRLLEQDVQQLTGEMAAIDIRQLSTDDNQSTGTAETVSAH